MSSKPSGSQPSPDDVWSEIKNAMDDIYNTDGAIGKRPLKKLQKLIVDMLENYEDNSVDSDSDSEEAPPAKKARKSSAAAQAIHTKLKDDLRARVAELKHAIEGKTEHELLEFFHTHWSRYNKIGQTLDKVFGSLSFWLRREIASGHANVALLALDIWRKSGAMPLQIPLIPALLSQIQLHRQGETINSSFLPKVVRCAAEIDRQFCLKFGNQFIVEMMQFYHSKCSDLLKQKPSLSTILLEAEQWLEKEETLCRIYLAGSISENTCLNNCLTTLLTSSKLLWSFPALLKEDNEEDLARFYRLARLHDYPLMHSLATDFDRFVIERGLEAVKSVSSAVLSADGQDAKLYVDTILGVHRKYYNLVLQAFSNNRRFVEALDIACRSFINRNEVTKLANDNQKTPELLVRYTDALLKSGSKDCNIKSEQLEDTMTMLKLVNDINIFRKYYTCFLGRRLLFSQSTSTDIEAQMISKMKLKFGFDYTYNMERMLHDIVTSRELNGLFHKFQSDEKAPLGLEFQVNVLSSQTWLGYASQGSAANIPSELQNCCTSFERFYKRTHDCRKLRYCYNLSIGELVAHFSGQSYTLLVSTYQIAVLMMFNTETSYSVQEIASTTSIEPQVLQQVLAILVRAKLLLLAVQESEAGSGSASTSSGGGSDLAPSSRLALNQDFKNKRLRINLNSQLKCESKQEQEQTSRLVEEDRSYMIQACLVRVMKTRKEMKHQKLVAEVISQLSQFKPSVQQIKKNIDTLIEKEYLQRKSGERDKYEYLA